jgi:ubiquinone/menaquinone biosynthesis C-methylase UbiE
MKLQVDLSHYFNKSYDTKEPFISYWHQIHEIILLKPKNVLEIGIGNGFVSKYLKERETEVTTLDIDKRLNPNIIGSLLELPFDNESFNIVTCYEVLEHLPYKDVSKALSEIYRVSNSHVILSIPDINRVYRLNVQIPKIGEIKRLIPFPSREKPIHNFNGEHYWKIGKASYSSNRIIEDIKKVGLKIEKTY